MQEKPCNYRQHQETADREHETEYLARKHCYSGNTHYRTIGVLRVDHFAKRCLHELVTDTVIEGERRLRPGGQLHNVVGDQHAGTARAKKGNERWKPGDDFGYPAMRCFGVSADNFGHLVSPSITRRELSTVFLEPMIALECVGCLMENK